jgi:YVTN family beta-propeller protein
MTKNQRRCLAAAAAVLFSTAVSTASDRKVRIIQTNSAGDNIHVIDPETNKVVGVITGIEVNHGAAVAPDGSRIYVSDEADSTLDVVDAKTLKVTNRIPLSGHPNNIADRPRRPACLRRDHPGAGRCRRHRHRDVEERQDASDQGHDSQRLRHARRQVRRGGFDRR